MSLRSCFLNALKKWLKTWAVVDVFVCGGALVASISYVGYRASHNTPLNGWVDLWPNFTSEVMGAWLSVRVIDYLIRRRSDRSRARWRQAGILMHWRDLADRIGRYGDDREAYLLDDELRFHEEPHNVAKRKRHLDESERTDVEAARLVARELLSEYKNYSKAKKACKTCEYDDPRKSELEAERERIHDIIQDKVDTLADVALKARTNILEEEFELE